MIRCLMDEHVPPALTHALRATEPALDVWRVGDPGAPRLGGSDAEILRWCEAHQFVLVTNNRSTMALHLSEHLSTGGHVPGILTLSLAMTVQETVDELLLIAGAAVEEELRDQVRFFPLA